MRVIKAHAKIEFAPPTDELLAHLERCGRTCYKSEDRITKDSAERFIKGIVRSGHESVLEHVSVTVRFVVDRGVSHELVRHRIASFSQESTRYCNYGKTGEITFIKPIDLCKNVKAYDEWMYSCLQAEEAYLNMLKEGCPPEIARAVLPNSVKAEVVMTANLREWRHFFKLRALGTNGKPHPQMLEVTIPLLEEFKKRIPAVFDDLCV